MNSIVVAIFFFFLLVHCVHALPNLSDENMEFPFEVHTG